MKPVEQIRRENFAQLVAEETSQAAFARKVGKDKNQINQWLGRAGARNISADTAREIEAKCGKPRGWLDHESATSGGGTSVDYASQSVGLDAGKLADLIETVEAAIDLSGRTLPAKTRARLIAAIYMDDQASAAGSAEAIQSALIRLLASMEKT